MNVELTPGEAVIIAIAPGNGWAGSPAGSSGLHAAATTADEVAHVQGKLVARACEAGTYQTTLSDGSTATTTLTVMPKPIGLNRWDVTVDDWQPAKPGQPSSHTNHVEWTFGDMQLTPWSSIPEITDAVGLARYSAVVTLPPSWAPADGAYLRLGAINGAFRVEVNDRSVGVANQLRGVIDIGPRLRRGRNEVEVVVATTMINRVRVFRPTFAARPKQEYGLLGPVTLIPYADMPITRSTKGPRPRS